jgi:hypothetical protein
MTNTKESWFYKLPEIVDDDFEDVVQLTVDFSYAANFATLRDKNTFIDISDISSLGLSKIRPGYFHIFFTLDDSKEKSVFKSIFFILAAPALPEENKLTLT